MTGCAENVRMMVTGEGVGVTLIAPGRVETDSWTAAGGPPEGLKLTAEHIAETIAWAVAQPKGVDVNTVVVRPRGQPH